MSVSAPQDRAAPGARSAARFRKPSWRDPRLLVGLLLVLLSVMGVVLLVATANRSEPYYVAADDLPVGQRITAEDLTTVDVHLQDAAGQYVRGDEVLRENTVVTQRVARGQLLPASAVGTADSLDRTPVGIALETPLPAQAGPGAHVDVWVAAPRPTGRGYAEPKKLVTAAEIAGVDTADTGLGGSDGKTVHVLVRQSQVGPLVDALGNDAKVTLVLNTGGSGS
ncbi:SAF domain-containing protein [Kocuria sp.]|uniref:SAF domain-containing protein n=1 Tax=Kocuria sp. TaxID=1871328 RepID=UPI0026DD0925|nr:SAF domain-containing protein [Kocuria sp.]MDO4918643.1 SAF domain-containing protein [Kocuria sp.]